MSDTIAKLLFIGDSQVVRLPKAFRFDAASEVLVRKSGNSIIFTPCKRAPIQRMIDALKTFEKFPEREHPVTTSRRVKRQVRPIVKASKFKVMAV